MKKTISFKSLKFRIFKNEDKTSNYKYNVQVFNKIANKYYYAGVGTFAKNKKEVKQYINNKKAEA